METFFGVPPKEGVHDLYVGGNIRTKNCQKTFQAKFFRTPKNLPAPTPMESSTVWQSNCNLTAFGIFFSSSNGSCS